MPWSVIFDSDTDIVEVIYTGRVTGLELKEAATERVRMQKKHDTSLVLVDASRTELLEAGLLDVHNLPAELYDNVEADRVTQLALISPRSQEARVAAKHFKTACLNRGWHVMTFEKRQNAIDWLQKRKPSRRPDTLDCL
jgi:hypothetical protein